MKKLFILFIGLFMLCNQTLFANDCDGFGDCDMRNICLQVESKFIAGVFKIELDFHEDSKEVTIHKEVNFKIPNMTNFTHPYYIGSSFSHAKFNFGDGNGYVNVSSNSSKLITYSNEGKKTLKAKIYYSYSLLGIPGSVDKVSSTIKLAVLHNSENDAGQYDYQSPDEIWQLTSDVYTPSCTGAYPNNPKYNTPAPGYGNAYIKYGNMDHVLRKPIVIVEGIDFGKNEECDPKTGQIIRYGDLGWDAMIMGLWEHKGSQQIEEMPIQFDDLIQEGYDIIVLDFKDGVDYIQRNALVLIKLLEKINIEKECSAEQTVVLGASMGGQVARFALTMMEDQNKNHDVRTYISFDSPHQGANVPLGLQALVYLADLEKPRKALSSPATLQLTYDNFIESVSNGDLEVYIDGTLKPAAYLHSSSEFICLRNNFVAERDALGYPKQARNIAIANGTQNVVDQGFNAGTELADVNLDITGLLSLDASMSSLNGNSNNNIVDINVDIGPLSIANTHIEVKVANGFPLYDTAPGCKQITIGDMLADFGVPMGSGSLSVALDAGNINLMFSVIGHNSFMPTISTLDVNTPNLLFDIENGNIIDNGLTPFDAYYAPVDENEQHVQITQENRDWMMNEIDNNLNELSGETISSGERYNFGGMHLFLNNFTITNGGFVGVNRPEPLGKPNSGLGLPSGKVDVVTGKCGVIVDNGGLLDIGGQWAQRATLRIPNGSTVLVKNGGKIYINSYSEIIIEEGGRLIVENGGQIIVKGHAKITVEKGADLVIEEGAKINYWKVGQNEARIILKGNLEVVKTSSTLPALLSGGGRLVLEQDGQVKMSANGTYLKISGPVGNQDPILELKEKLSVDGNNKRLILKDGEVKYHDGGLLSINVGAKFSADRVYFKGGATPASAIKGYGTNMMQVVRSDFDGFAYAIQLVSCSGTAGYPYYVSESTFSNSDCIKLENVSRFRISNSDLDGTNHMVAGVDAKNVGILEINHTDIENFGFGLYLDNVSSCKFKDGKLENNDWGIFDDASSYVRIYDGTLVKDNTTAIEMTGGFSGSTVSMNCVTFDGNVDGIRGTDITLDIDPILNNGGSNIFKNISSTGKLFDICYENTSVSGISMTYNYWDGLATLPSSYYSLNNTERGGCSLTVPTDASNALAGIPTECEVINVVQVYWDEEGGMIAPTNGGTPNATIVDEGNSKEQGLASSMINLEYLRVDATIYPNPMTTSATLQYSLSADAEVNIRLMNTLGQVIKVLKSERATAGEYQLAINRESLNAGMYFCEITVNNQRKVIKFVIN